MTIGRAIAANVYGRLEARRKLLPPRLVLGLLCGEPDTVMDSFIRIKARAAARLGVAIARVDIPLSAREAGARAAIADLARRTDGIIVQLPLPREWDVQKVLAAIPGSHDVDGIGDGARVMPPVARAVKEILESASIDPAGKSAIVIGAGRLVGAPVARMLEDAGAQVTVITEGRSLDALAEADIIVSGAGSPGLITPEMIREGVALIDAGTSEQGGKVRGDADPACAAKCALFTPVPGGVGPVAVAEIFENLFDLVEKR